MLAFREHPIARMCVPSELSDMSKCGLLVHCASIVHIKRVSNKYHHHHLIKKKLVITI